ncbi:MAG: hypothetical protein Q7R65_03810 [bacterium]|nr:hypothetical protein [bacterium]
MKNSQKGFAIPLIIAMIAVLVIGAGVYVYKNKKTESPAVVDTGTQQSNQNQQQTNTQNPTPITKPDLKSQPEANLDCGAVLDEDLLTKPENRSASEKTSLECFAKAIFSCQTASLKVTGKDAGGFEIVKKEGGNCVIKSKASEMKQCAVPMNLITDLKNYAETQNLFIGDIIAPLSFMIAFEQGKNSQTGEQINLSCTKL